MKPPVLQSERLSLRPYSWRDLSSVFDLCSRFETSRYSLWEPHKNYWDTLQYLFFVKYRSAGIHWLCENEKGEIIGSCSFVTIDWEKEEGEIGYSVHPDYWHLGLGGEIAETLLEYGFSALMLKKIFARIMPQNVRSVALVKRLGMKPAEREEKPVVYKGVQKEIIRLEISDKEYSLSRS